MDVSDAFDDMSDDSVHRLDAHERSQGNERVARSLYKRIAPELPERKQLTGEVR